MTDPDPLDRLSRVANQAEQPAPGFSDRLLDELLSELTADQTGPTSSSFDHSATEATMDVVMFSADGNERRTRYRNAMLVAASVAALALVGGLIVIANRDSDIVPADQPMVTVPITTGADGETAPAPDAEQQDTVLEAGEPGAGEPLSTTEAPQAQDDTITGDVLHGYWLNIAGGLGLFVDFRTDGTFTIGDSGRLGSGAFTNGTFEAPDDTTVSFQTADDASECPGVTVTWTDVVNDQGVMTVDALAPDCRVPDATQQEWTRVSPASTASLKLEAGDLDVEPVPVTESLEIEGLWLRVGTGDVLALDPAGTYLLTPDGNSLEPLDSGTFLIGSPGVVTFASDGSGECEAGEAWTWQGVTTAKDLLRENQARGFSMRADSTELCGGSAGTGDSWRLMATEKT